MILHQKSKRFSAKGSEASHLRRRKYELCRRFRFPEALLLGSLSWVQRRCGKAACWCAGADGHPMWILSLSLDGRRVTETIPEDQVPEVEALLERGRALKDALSELGTINGMLFRLSRVEESRLQTSKRRRSRKTATQKKKGHPAFPENKRKKKKKGKERSTLLRLPPILILALGFIRAEPFGSRGNLDP